jgi:hypothetical protein
MYLIFLGNTETVGMLLKDVLTTSYLYSKFHKHNHPLIPVRWLQLDWCKSWPFGSDMSPFGPWISENDLVYARMFKSIYSYLDEIRVDDLRDISTTLVQTWVAVVSRLMQNKVNDELIESTERHIKLYVSTLCDLEVALDKNKKVKLSTTSNLNALFNLYSIMKNYGPTRLYWEGGYKGEAMFQDIKPLITQGTHKPTFSKNALLKYYKHRFITKIMNQNKTQQSEGDGSENYPRYTKFRTYQTKEQINKLITTGEAISVVILINGDISISHYDNGQHKACKVIPDDDKSITINGTYTTTLSCGDEINIQRLQLMKKEEIQSYALALPIYSPIGKKNI